MREHLLLEKAYIYPLPKGEPKMEGCYYNNKLGYWEIIDTNTPYVNETKRPKPQSKKADIETGEDQKGE